MKIAKISRFSKTKRKQKEKGKEINTGRRKEKTKETGRKTWKLIINRYTLTYYHKRLILNSHGSGPGQGNRALKGKFVDDAVAPQVQRGRLCYKGERTSKTTFDIDFSNVHS